MSRRRAPKVSVRVTPGELIVEIRGLPHVIVRRADLSGIESWQMTVGAAERFYFIEYTTRHGRVTCDYETRALWEEILRQLGAAKIFHHVYGEPAR